MVQFRHDQLEEVGALPDACGSACRPELAALSPLAQVARTEKEHLLFDRERHDHDPLLLLLVPEDLWVAEVLFAEVDDRVACELGPRAPAVVRVRDALRLLVSRRLRVDSDHRRHVWVRLEAARVAAVDDRAAGKDHHAVFLGKRDG